MRASQVAASLLPRANLTSIIVLIINCAFFLAEVIVNSQLTHRSLFNSFSDINTSVVVLLGGKYTPYIFFRGQWWRLMTAGVLHAGFVHLAMNSYALFILVTEVEQFYGTSRLVVAYAFSSFTGFLLSLYWSPGSVSLGASAAAFGLIGIMLAMSIRRRSDPLVQMVRAQYTQWVIFSLVMSFLPGVDLAAHVGGFAGGFAVGLIAGLPGVPNSPREVLWKVLAAVAICGALYALAQDYLSFRTIMRQV
ncbi:MAG: rhomboid family intramembrane serine protease [Acidobacteriaceae bacterium]|nr:rhomboid family intramembrane serine protease [Acidobacteriaceae bacterium]